MLWVAVNMLSGLETGPGDGSPMAAAIKPGDDAVGACLKRVNGTSATRELVWRSRACLVSYKPLGRQIARI